MVKTKQEITQYVKRFCKKYSLSYSDFFYEYDEFDMRQAAPVFGKESIESKLPVISEYFGLTDEEILTTSEEGLDKWYKKYSFFYHLPKFTAAYKMSRLGNDEDVAMAHLLNAIWGEHSCKYPTRYNKSDIKERVVAKLKELDTIMPGTYHDNAEMLDFTVETENFCSYPQIGEMIYSLLQMIYRAKELFFKAKDRDLTENETFEYNFLVSVLGIKDVASNKYLYYRNVVALRNVYIEEGYKDFYSYVRLMNYKELNPWRAKEFLDDKSLMQAYLNEYAEEYWTWKEQSKKIAKFVCSFVWSDAPIMREPDFGISIPELDDDSNDGIPEMTTIYLDKTNEEMRSDKELAEKLLACFGCKSNGGLSILPRELPFQHYYSKRYEKTKERIIKHVDALKEVDHD